MRSKKIYILWCIYFFTCISEICILSQNLHTFSKSIYFSKQSKCFLKIFILSEKIYILSQKIYILYQNPRTFSKSTYYYLSPVGLFCDQDVTALICMSLMGFSAWWTIGPRGYLKSCNFFHWLHCTPKLKDTAFSIPVYFQDRLEMKLRPSKPLFHSYLIAKGTKKRVAPSAA